MFPVAAVIGVTNLVLTAVGGGTTIAGLVEGANAKEEQKEDQINAAQDQVEIKIQNDLIQTSKGLQAPR